MNNKSTEQYVTVNEAAELLSVSTRTIHRYIETGYLSVLRPAVPKRAVRISKSEIDKLLRKG